MKKNPFERRFIKKRNDTEHKIQSEYFKILKLNESKYPRLGFIFAIPNGGKRHIATAVKMKAEGVKRGVPDIFIPIPVRYYSGFFLEVKTEKGVLSEYQKSYKFYLESQNYKYCVCRSVQKLIYETGKYLEINLAIDEKDIKATQI